ncbi:MAG: hypothetical protein NC396_08530 [Bacteroides sp.]|nr:hypothetical protein [Bacteroides sp.]MCM1085107.1 hypothetical protein [Bacteroides sp.]
MKESKECQTAQNEKKSPVQELYKSLVNKEVSLIERHKVEDTPFEILKHNGRYFIVLAEKPALGKSFPSIRAAKKEIKRKPYDLIAALAIRCAEVMVNINNQKNNK